MRRSRRILLETGVLGAALCASAMIFVLSVAAPIAAHDRDDDNDRTTSQCWCVCQPAQVTAVGFAWRHQCTMSHWWWPRLVIWPPE